MADLLEHVSFDFERRMTARRGMIAHLGLCPDGVEASEIREELRGTLLACGQCDAPGRCLAWQKTARPGMPPSCRARDAFARLAAACDRQGKKAPLRPCA